MFQSHSNQFCHTLYIAMDTLGDVLLQRWNTVKLDLPIYEYLGSLNKEISVILQKGEQN